MGKMPTRGITPEESGLEWIDDLSDQACAEILWLYVDPPEPFLERHPPELLGQALRFALRQIARLDPGVPDPTRSP
jgi:hypothetical protein